MKINKIAEKNSEKEKIAIIENSNKKVEKLYKKSEKEAIEEINKINEKYPGITVIIGDRGKNKGFFNGEIDFDEIKKDGQRLLKKYPGKTIKFKVGPWVIWSNKLIEHEPKPVRDNLKNLKACPFCKTKIVGTLQRTCSNPRCRNYYSHLFRICRVCQQPIHSCSH